MNKFRMDTDHCFSMFYIYDLSITFASFREDYPDAAEGWGWQVRI